MSRRISFKDAVSFVPDDLPDGAFFAMAHEMAGLDYGDGFAELFACDPSEAAPAARPAKAIGTVPCRFGCGKMLRTEGARDQHHRDKHGKRMAKEAKAAFADATAGIAT